MTPELKPTEWGTAVVALIEAVLLAMAGSGMLTMSNEQIQLWVNVAFAVAVVLTPVLGGLWVRYKTTALADPKDEDGEPLVRLDGAMPKAQMRYFTK